MWPKIQHAFKLSNKAILVMLASVVPLYGCLGFLPGLKGHVGGLVTAGEMYALAVYFGKPEYTSAIIMLMFGPRLDLRCFPGVFSCCVFRTDSAWRGSTMVWVVLDYGQVEQLPGTSGRRRDQRCYWEHSLRILLPCWDGMVGSASASCSRYSDWSSGRAELRSWLIVSCPYCRKTSCISSILYIYS